MPGGGGMIAISQFVTTKEGNKTAVVVQGAGTVFFPLTNKTPVTLADVRPLARLAGEYEVIAVRQDSDVKDFKDLMARFKADPGSVAWGGGSPGSTENIFFARLAKIAGMTPKQVNFIPHPNTGEVVISALNGQATVVGGGLQDFKTQSRGEEAAAARGRLRPSGFPASMSRRCANSATTSCSRTGAVFPSTRASMTSRRPPWPTCSPSSSSRRTGRRSSTIVAGSTCTCPRRRIRPSSRTRHARRRRS